MIGTLISSAESPIDWLLEEEKRVINQALLVIKGGLVDEDTRLSYITANTQIQSDLVNLKSRVNYVLMLKEREQSRYEASVIDQGEYGHLSKSDRNVCMFNDSRYNDLKSIIEQLSILSKYVEELTWILKTAVNKV